MFPKTRLDALTDGVFAVAMTLLVIELRLPEHFDPKDAGELLHRLYELGPQVIIYIVSFYVLSLCWFGRVRVSPPGEQLTDEYVKWALFHMLLITFVPFTTMLVGRYPTMAPAIWLYAANTILFALVAIRMAAIADRDNTRKSAAHWMGLGVLIAASVLVILLSFVIPKGALLGYLLNLVDEPARWILRKRGGTGAAGAR